VCDVELACVTDIPLDRVIKIDCPACETFVSEIDKIDDCFREEREWTSVKRAALSHALRRKRTPRTYSDTNWPLLSTEEVFSNDWGKMLTLPNRFEQKNNAVRYLGDIEIDQGDVPSELRYGVWAFVGSASPKNCSDLFNDMINLKLVSIDLDVRPQTGVGSAAYPIRNARLTLEGWQLWQELREGRASSENGFIAMQFGDERLDRIIAEAVQGRVAGALGVRIERIDSPGKTRAGLIDNNMREAIEDAAFVLVELSHGNKGAYWEAGLAEGLRKPVIYLCEQSVWDSPQTRPHFDVNHRTTIMWDEDKADEFVEALTNTIRNSLRQRNT